ncbi:cyclin-dependent kinase 11B [Bemisia tabaci]|nr:PREDICTED: cyclin-dependent kinase 11B isoform X2 [Bemisia tabaci]
MSDEEDGLDVLNIKPPQAVIAKPSRSKHSDRLYHSRSSSSSSQRKSHHRGHHHEERRRRHREKDAEQKELFLQQQSLEIYPAVRRRQHDESRDSHRSRHEQRRERREEKESRKEQERLFRNKELERDRERDLRNREEEEERFMRTERARNESAELKLLKLKEVDLREKLQKKKVDPQKEREQVERDQRRDRILAAEKIRDACKRELEERRKKNYGQEREQDARSLSRSKSRSPNHKESDNDQDRRMETDDAGLVYLSDESRSPLVMEPLPQTSPMLRSPSPMSSQSSSPKSKHNSDNADTHDSDTNTSRSSNSSSTPESSDDQDRNNGRNRNDKNIEGLSPEREHISNDVHANEESEMEILAAESLPPYLPAIQGCRNVEEFDCLNRIEEGTYGVVYRARDKRTNEIVALKRLKMEKEKEGFPITSLREISTLLKAQHPNIVTVREIVVGSNMDKIYIVMDYVEHDLKSLMKTMKSKKQVFLPGEIKCLMEQLLKAVNHLHDNWILHRDLKASNLLLSHKGILKVGDFGLAREYGSPLKQYTPIVVTLWYRAPELLLCTKEYSTKIDMWSVGCIFAEFLTMEPLFQGKNECNQIHKIFEVLGTPNDTIWPGYSQFALCQKVNLPSYPGVSLKAKFAQMISDAGLKLLSDFLTYDPNQRISADAALKSNYFKELPKAIDPSMFPTWPAKSEMGHRKAASPKPPSGGQMYKNMAEDDRFHMGGVANYRSNLGGGGFSLKF